MADIHLKKTYHFNELLFMATLILQKVGSFSDNTFRILQFHFKNTHFAILILIYINK